MQGQRVYPKEFSQDARNRVEIANVNAGRDLAQRRKTIASPYPGTTSEEFNRAFLSAVIGIFLAFAEEAVKLKDTGKWSLDRVRQDSEEFLRCLLIYWWHPEGHDRSGAQMREVTDQGSVREWVTRMIREMPEWEDYEDLLLGIPRRIRKTPALAAEEIDFNSDQARRFRQAEEKLDSGIAAHQQMRDLINHDGWSASSSSAGSYTIEEQIRKLESELRDYLATVVGVRAEALFVLSSLEPFRSALVSDAAALLELALSRVAEEDLSLIDKESLGTTVKVAVDKWIDKAKREFTANWIPDYQYQPPSESEAEKGRPETGKPTNDVDPNIAPAVAGEPADGVGSPMRPDASGSPELASGGMLMDDLQSWAGLKNAFERYAPAV